VHKFLLAVVVVTLAGLGAAVSASQVRAATECNGVVTGTITGGLVVHPGDNCDVEGATISGGIHMDGGTLRVCSSTIGGGVIVAVSGANSASSWVDFGNLENGCGGNNVTGGGVNIRGVHGVIPGDEQSASVELEGNTISGGLTVSDNGLVEVESNHVSGGAHCNGPTSNFINFLGPNTYQGGNHGCPD
jgi:hypothetical protein